MKHFLLFAVLFLLCSRFSFAQEVQTEVFPFYIGTYTNGTSEGIYLSSLNSDSGEIGTPQLVASLKNASFQCISSENQKLWSVSETADGKGLAVEYSLNDKLMLLKNESFSTNGSGPCYVDFHEATESVLTANYRSGNVTRNTKEQTISHQHLGKGPNSARQEGPHAHCFKVDLNGKYGYSCDLGTDKVYVYNLESPGLQLIAEVETLAGAGPRHLDFHPSGTTMAVINELNSTIEVFAVDEQGCFTKRLSSTTTIPDTHSGNNQCADIHYSEDGRFLYASNRGHNSIAVFSVKNNYELELIQWMDKGISWPRNFALSPDGRLLLVANQHSNTITVYAVDKVKGVLKKLPSELELDQPVCITFLNHKL